SHGGRRCGDGAAAPARAHGQGTPALALRVHARLGDRRGAGAPHAARRGRAPSRTGEPWHRAGAGRRRRRSLPHPRPGGERRRRALRRAAALRARTAQRHRACTRAAGRPRPRRRDAGGRVSHVTVIRGARHWKSGEPIDLAFERGVILDRIPDQPDVVVDAAGAVLSPGLVDLHVPLREPGQGSRETIETGTHAAAAGGFTAVACMPNTEPVVDNVAWVEWVRSRARAVGRCRVHPIAAVTIGQKGERLTEALALRNAGAVALSD